jgi:ABC-2 type transport system ATP-binding protein
MCKMKFHTEKTIHSFPRFLFMANTIVSIRHLAKQFGSFQALKEINLEVKQGDIYGFLGQNGAGKSTTMRCMLSLIRPDAGDIELFGLSLSKHREAILARIGCLIEKPDFYKYLSAFKNLQILSRISGKASSTQEIYDMLEFVGLAGREKDLVGGFSHGMRQRLGIAQTLLHDPDLIVLDEPTTGLDPQGIIDMRNLILRLNKEKNKTIILSSHNLHEVELICNRMVIIHQGQSLVEGSVENLLQEEDQIIRVQMTPAGQTQAISILGSQFPQLKYQVLGLDSLEIQLAKEAIPNLNAAFVAAGISIFAMEAKRKLEDYFINLVSA